ncbi:MAG: tyrosine-protein phosphatase [Rhizobiales bacterium]|nr:tyrosine-protein phosphatase [Hyphomicrobiales bacterium]
MSVSDDPEQHSFERLLRFSGPINGPEQRRAAWMDLLFRDQGIWRLFWKNRRKFAARAWRSNQPMPRDIRWAADQGIRTIINARHDAGRHGGHALAKEAALDAGLAYITLESSPIFSRAAPSREALLGAAEVLLAAPGPVLIHCKSGADRAGFLSALYRIVVEGHTVHDAAAELTLRHLHFARSKTGILDAVFAAYLAETATTGKPFLDWVRDDYNPEAITKRFRAGFLSDILDRFILRRE